MAVSGSIRDSLLSLIFLLKLEGTIGKKMSGDIYYRGEMFHEVTLLLIIRRLSA